MRVPCTIWNELAVMLHEYIKVHATSKDPIIILMVMAKKSMWDGRYFGFQFCYARFKKGYHNF